MLLGSLVDQSLVIAEPRAQAMRYRLLETVREYGLERLTAAGETELVRDRHRDVFLALAEEAAPHLESPRQAEWLARLEPEAANLAAAIEHALGSDPSVALRLCAALYPFWRARGRFAEAALAQSRALAAGARRRARRCARGCSVTSATRSIGQGDPEAAHAHATEALALAEQAGDRSAAARARCRDRQRRCSSRTPRAARTEFARAAELARAAGDDWALIQAHLAPAFGATLQNDHALALRLSDAVADVVERSGEPYQVARRHYFAGMAAVNDGRLDEARDAVAEARAAVADVWEPIQEARSGHRRGARRHLVGPARGRRSSACPDSSSTRSASAQG